MRMVQSKGPQRDQMEDWEEDSPMEMEERLEEKGKSSKH